MKSRRDYLKVVLPEEPDPVLVCLNKEKLNLLKKRFPGLVIYFPEELEEMSKFAHSQEALKALHLVKKEFPDSVVIPDNKQFIGTGSTT